MAKNKNDKLMKSGEKCACDCACCNKICARMKKVHPVFAAVVFIVVIALGFGLGGAYLKIQRDDISRLQTQISQLKSDQKTTDVRENGVSYTGEEGKTAMELLEKNHQITTKDYGDLGKFVTSINGVSSTDGENFWAFYVDGQMAAEGASTYQTKNGEKIEWKLEPVASY